jgi:hypothetical protein
MFSRDQTDGTEIPVVPAHDLEAQPTAQLPPLEATQLAHRTVLSTQHQAPDQTVCAPGSVQIGSADVPEATAYPANYAQPGLPQSIHARQEYTLPFPPASSSLQASKRHVRLWPLLLAVVVFVLGSGTALAVVVSQQPGNTPTQVLQNYCDGYKTSNAQEIYDSLSTASRKATSLRKIQQGFDVLKLFGNTAHISDCTISNVQQQETTASGDVKMTVDVLSGNFSFSTEVRVTMGLVLEDNSWKVDTQQTRLIAPTPQTTPGLLLTPTLSRQ